MATRAELTSALNLPTGDIAPEPEDKWGGNVGDDVDVTLVSTASRFTGIMELGVAHETLLERAIAGGGGLSRMPRGSFR